MFRVWPLDLKWLEWRMARRFPLSLALSLSGKPRIRAEKEGKEGGEEREGDVVRSSEAVPLGRMPQTETNLEIETRRDKKRKEKMKLFLLATR